MSILSENIRFLRDNMKASQQKVADEISITRGRYSTYEEGRSEPPIELLIKISKYFKVNIDLLITVDLKKYSVEDLVSLPNNRTLLPMKVDQTGENKIEIVPQKASMGYLNGYSDPDFVDSLQHLSLPFLRNGKFRAFPADGDSMPPYNDGTFIVGKYVEDRKDLKKGKTYIFITKDGIVYKRYSHQNDSGSFVSSDNTFYEPYEIKWHEVYEIWEFACSINTQELRIENLEYKEIRSMFEELRSEIRTSKKTT
ncbi:XRE family transcriptional regulator [Chryseobacterium caseinilyticum]|uniref:LexA family transcriptional regulator n=1 Tax=Chryseobacterium caseinilyticum TaxID=2771428 RepID=A0ABR8Z8C6_9FLAO|nr:LexA family transcriptional regulator [Chryseobacterium caseinilyticum]MBD8081495.1 LexA family transcriptional regulator [Chryseobacterium caseinilyticum]